MLKVRHILLGQCRRWKHSKDHWSELQKRKHVKDKALENFDDFYGSVFGKRWPSMRAALLTRHKYMALVNNFGDTEQTIELLQSAGAISLRDIYNVARASAPPAAIDNSSDRKNRSIDDKLSGIMQRQHDQQDPLVEQYGQPASEPQAAETGERVHYKKPLERVLTEDADLDYRRTVDSTLGTAGLHEFIPATRLKGMEDWVLESDHYKYYSTSDDFPLRIEPERAFDFPEHLHLYTFEPGNVSAFGKARRSCTNVSSHYILNGSSVLPALVLGVRPGDRVLDACSSPGGKALLLLQTLLPEQLVCNDVQESRLNRVRKTFSEFLFDFDERWVRNGRCAFRQQDARTLDEYGQYDRVLVDVPCTTDRRAVMASENNIFKSTRVRERLQLPELQSAILANCLRLLRPGGSLVYATCSLSPVQNDGVVHMALSSVFREHGLTATIKNLSHVMQPFHSIFRFEPVHNLKYGQLVVPFMPSNFGPMYFSKITRDL